MRDSLKSNMTWSSLGWLVPLAFLALPDCGFPGRGDPDPNLERGDLPHRAVVFCDIEQHEVHLRPPRCATALDLQLSNPLQAAAVALARGNNQFVGLDYRPEAPAERGLTCPTGTPVAITFHNRFPHGTPVCLNADVIGPGLPYPDADAACVAECYDRFGEYHGGTLYPDNPPSPETQLFCSQHARASTNAKGSPWSHFSFLGACTDAGNLPTDFLDPRRIPEPVHWRDKVGVVASGGFSNTLTRTIADSGAFDAGAASIQSITTGDAYVEFTATETNTGRACGLSSGAADDDSPDLDATLTGIGFAVRLGALGNIFIQENGTPVPGPDPSGSFGMYSAGDRIRLTVTDNLNGTASIAYRLIPPACSAGPLCDGTLLRSGAGPALYPFRVDASFRTPGATLTRVEMVRIKPF